MRTTLTLEKDVAAMLERLRKSRDASMKALVNEALREGLKHLDAPRRKQAPLSHRLGQSWTLPGRQCR